MLNGEKSRVGTFHYIARDKNQLQSSVGQIFVVMNPKIAIALISLFKAACTVKLKTLENQS